MASPILPDDAGTVFHLWVDGGVVKDTKSNSWVEHGTVPRVAKQSLGFENGAQAEGIGPFTDSNFFSLGSGNNPFALGGGTQRWTALVRPSIPIGSNGSIVGNNPGNRGVTMRLRYDGADPTRGQFNVEYAAYSGMSTLGLGIFAAHEGVTSIVSWGISVADQNTRGIADSSNLGGYDNSIALNMCSGADPLYVGRDLLGARAFSGTIYELMLTTVPISNTDATTIAFHNSIRTTPIVEPSITVVRAGDLGQTYAVGAPDGGITTVRIAYIVQRAKDAPPPDSWLAGKYGHMNRKLNGGMN